MNLQGTMEQRVYSRQVVKESIAKRVIDAEQIFRHFKQDDLQKLYTFDPNIYDESRPSLNAEIVPKDQLLAQMITSEKRWIVAYCEHDCLLGKFFD